MVKKRGAGGRRSKGKRSNLTGKRPSERSGVAALLGIEAKALREFFEAAGEFADAESRLIDTGAFRLDAPAVGLQGVVACVVDLSPAGTGFLVLPSVEHYRDLTIAEKRPPRDRSGILVLFASLEALAKPVRRTLEELGWTRSKDGRFPLLTKQGVAGKEIAATADDYRLATLAAAVMAHVSRTAGESLHARNEGFLCTLEVPGLGEVDVLHPGDLDEDELDSIVEEGIEATVRIPEQALAAALDLEILSPKARRVLARAGPAASRADVELRASLDELDHVGKLLLAASRKRGRPAILGELAVHLLAASEGPDSLLVEPPPEIRTTRRSAGEADHHDRRRSRAGPSRGAELKRRLYRLKVTLRRIRPPIWRRIEVCSDIKLAGLHTAIQDAMGWADGHLHEFECGGERYGRHDDAVDGFGDRARDEKRTRLDALLRKPKDALVYLYDFGDGWEHHVVLEAIEALPPEQRAPRPRCIGGRRACPPEDCGGPGGYARMLEVLANPRDPEHASYREWLDDGFHPEAF